MASYAVSIATGIIPLYGNDMLLIKTELAMKLANLKQSRKSMWKTKKSSFLTSCLTKDIKIIRVQPAMKKSNLIAWYS